MDMGNSLDVCLIVTSNGFYVLQLVIRKTPLSKQNAMPQNTTVENHCKRQWQRFYSNRQRFSAVVVEQKSCSDQQIHFKVH
jgi:hypothetical protein